jgi:Lipocalin-like domain
MAKLGLLLVVGVLVAGSTALETHAQSPDDVVMAKRFIGMWRLVSHVQHLADGTSRRTANSQAYIIYTDTTPVHMCYVSMDPNRPKWQMEFSPTATERASGTTGAYCSTVEVHAKEGFVLHHVEIAEVPNVVGRTRKRWFTFEGPNRVSLRIEPAELRAPVVDDTLTWERVQ